MRIGLIYNHFFATPAINELISRQALAGLAVPKVDHEMMFRTQMLAHQQGLQFLAAEKKGLAGQLRKWISDIEADAVFVIAFPWRIPAAVLSLPKHGFFNFHPSLLPAYRGPDPIFWQLKNDEKQSGITVHAMDADFDTGPIIHSESFDINSRDTYGMVLNRMAIPARDAARAMLENLIEFGEELPHFAQNPANASYQSRPAMEELVIDWQQQSARSVQALCRACNPGYKGALSFLGNIPIRFLQITVDDNLIEDHSPPGTMLTACPEKGIRIATCEGKSVLLDIASTEDGIFSGPRLVKNFGLQAGEQFGLPVASGQSA